MRAQSVFSLALVAFATTSYASPEPLADDVKNAIVAAEKDINKLTARQVEDYASLAALVASTHTSDKRQSEDDLNAILTANAGMISHPYPSPHKHLLNSLQQIMPETQISLLTL